MGEQILISSLDIAHRKFAITPKNQFQDQKILIQSIQNTSQQSTKRILVEEIERDFTSIKIIN